MKRKIFGWSLALVVMLMMAALLLTSAIQGPPPISAQPTAKRDPSKVADIEVELILNKIREGDLLAMKNEMAAARKAWREARRLGEGLWPIHEGLGDSYARVKLFDDAIREYLAAEPLVPEKHLPIRLSIMGKRADALAASGRALDAIGAYLELGRPAAVGGRILELAEKVDRESAIKLVQRRAEIYDSHVFHLLAALYQKFGRKVEAAEALAKFCIAAAPWDENLNRQAVDGLRAARRFDLAVDVCRAWVRSTPQAIQAYELMGDLLREAGREKEAIVAYTSIVDVRPGDAAAHRMLGDIFRKLNRIDEAIAQYEAAKKARPEDQSTYTGLMALYESKGDSAKAEEVLMEASKRFGGITGELRSRVVASYQDQIAKLKAAGRTEEVRALRRKLADLNVEEAGLFDIKIIMTWDVPSDVDMDVYEPGGEHIEHSHPHSKSGGHYYVDNTTAYGPETYTLKIASPGTYRVGAHLHGSTRSTAKFVVILYEDTPREERREESFILDKGGEPKFIRDIVIAP